MQAAQAPQMHPVMSGLLAGIAPTPIQLDRARYASRLTTMDWQFEAADGAIYRAGRDELQALRELQPALDPDAEIWNRIATQRGAPIQYLITRRVKVVVLKPDGERVTTRMSTGLNDMGLRMFMVERHGTGTQVLEVSTMPSGVAREAVA